MPPSRVTTSAERFPVAAQEITVGDADLGARKLFLPDELVAAGERWFAELDWRLGLAQRGTEMPLAQQILGHPLSGDSNLSSHPTDRGVRAYARRLSVSPAAVRKGVAEGRIPIGAEGRILPDAADAALARGVVSGPTVSRTLAEARRRKLAASVRLLDDELAELRANSVTPADLKRDWLEACRLVAAEVERTFGVNVPRTEGDAQTGFPCCTR